MIDTFGRRRARIRGVINSAARHLYQGESEAAMADLDRLTAAGGPAAIGDCRAAASMLDHTIAQMINHLCAHSAHHRTFGIVLNDEQGQVAIDDVPPPLRAGIRAMVAELNGDHETTTIELDLAFASCDVRTARAVAAQSLIWVTDLIKECERMHEESPMWLR